MKKKSSDKESSELFAKLMKNDEDFADLVNERNKIVGIIEHHQIVTEALFTELEKWDIKVETVFQKELDKTDSFDCD